MFTGGGETALFSLWTAPLFPNENRRITMKVSRLVLECVLTRRAGYILAVGGWAKRSDLSEIHLVRRRMRARWPG